MGGISGAVLILPFQVSVLGFIGPAVSSTNLLFNIVAIPTGVLRYIREKRMIWPLAWIIVVGTMPGLILGAWFRIRYLPDPASFKLFAGVVLAYIGVRLLLDFLKKSAAKANSNNLFEVSDVHFTFSDLTYRFNGEQFRIQVWKVAVLSLIVGMVGGIYGIGGGAIIAPFLVAMFALPVHSIAGVTLFGTFISSIFGVISYAGFSAVAKGSSLPVSPDWLLGGMFGLGGAAGMYLGARMQKFIPARIIKGILALLVLSVASRYILDYFIK